MMVDVVWLRMMVDIVWLGMMVDVGKMVAREKYFVEGLRGEDLFTRTNRNGRFKMEVKTSRNRSQNRRFNAKRVHRGNLEASTNWCLGLHRDTFPPSAAAATTARTGNKCSINPSCVTNPFPQSGPKLPKYFVINYLHRYAIKLHPSIQPSTRPFTCPSHTTKTNR